MMDNYISIVAIIRPFNNKILLSSINKIAKTFSKQTVTSNEKVVRLMKLASI